MRDAEMPTEERFTKTGHYPVWPFISVRDYKAALKNPKRLGCNQ